MKESLGKSLGTFLEERLSNPIVGSFIISWCFWNYKFFIALFSNNTVTETIRLIDKVLYPGWVNCLLQGFLLPIGSAVLYLWLVPIITRHYYDLTAKVRKAQDEAMYEAEKHKRLSAADSAELQDTVRRTQVELDTQTTKVERLKGELSNAADQNTRWQDSIRNLQSELKSAKNDADKLRDSLAEQSQLLKGRNLSALTEAFQVAKRLTAAEIIALKSIADSSGGSIVASFADLAIPELNQAEASSTLRFLKDKGLVTQTQVGAADLVFTITHAGIDALRNRSVLDAVMDSPTEGQSGFGNDFAPFRQAAKDLTDLDAKILNAAAESKDGSVAISGLETKTPGYDQMQISIALERLEKLNYVEIRRDIHGGAVVISSIGKAVQEARKHLSR